MQPKFVKDGEMPDSYLHGFKYRPDLKPAAVFCDGGLIPDPDPSVTSKNPSTLGGTWAYLWVDESFENIVRHSWGAFLTRRMVSHYGYPVTGYDKVDNNLSELIAGIYSLQGLPQGFEGPFYTDSLCTIGRLFGINGKRYAMNGIEPHIIERAHSVTERLGDMHPILLDGHPSQWQLISGYGDNHHPVSIFNVICDDWCTRVADSVVSMYVPPQEKVRA